MAIADLDLLLQKKPTDPALLLRLGMAHVGNKNTARAIEIFDRLLATRPSGAAYYGRAMAHVVANQKDAGLRDLDQAIALEPGNAAYKNVRAQIAAQK